VAVVLPTAHLAGFVPEIVHLLHREPFGPFTASIASNFVHDGTSKTNVLGRVTSFGPPSIDPYTTPHFAKAFIDFWVKS
jgi:hypothetical protein